MIYWFKVWRAFYHRRKAMRILSDAKFHLWTYPDSEFKSGRFRSHADYLRSTAGGLQGQTIMGETRDLLWAIGIMLSAIGCCIGSELAPYLRDAGIWLVKRLS